MPVGWGPLERVEERLGGPPDSRASERVVVFTGRATCVPFGPAFAVDIKGSVDLDEQATRRGRRRSKCVPETESVRMMLADVARLRSVAGRPKGSSGGAPCAVRSGAASLTLPGART